MAKRVPKPAGLVGYVDDLAGRLRTLVPSALAKGDSEAIHHARVTTRRLSAALELFAPALDESRRKDVGRTLKKLRRRLGPLRDLDVLIGHVEALRETRRFQEASVWLVEQLRHQRQKAGQEATTDGGMHKLLGRLGEWWAVQEQIAEARPAAVGLLRDSLLPQLERFAMCAGSLSPGADARAGGERHDPHELRIAGKELRYTLEMAKAQGLPIKAGVLRQFKKMQDALGLWHDYAVLSQRALEVAVDEGLVIHDGELYGRVLALAAHSSRRADAYLRKFSELWQSAGAPIKVAIAGMFAESQLPESPSTPTSDESITAAPDLPPTPPQTDPDPGGSVAPSAPGDAVRSDPPDA